MEKKVTPMGLVSKSVAQKVSAYDWKSQGADTVKFGTHGNTTNQYGQSVDGWND